ncbi:RING-H2 finger protein ATL20-like [Fagus crenata]
MSLHDFSFRVYQQTRAMNHMRDGDMFPIIFRICQLKKVMTFIGDEAEPRFISQIRSERRTTFWLSKSQLPLQHNDFRLSQLLTNMNVPAMNIEPVLQKISCLARLDTTATSELLPIVVFLVYMTVEQQQPDSNALDAVTLESMETFEARPIPATKSSIEALEKVQSVSVSVSVGECIICLQEFEIGSEVTRMSITEIVSSSGWRLVTTVPCADTQCPMSIEIEIRIGLCFYCFHKIFIPMLKILCI